MAPRPGSLTIHFLCLVVLCDNCLELFDLVIYLLIIFILHKNVSWIGGLAHERSPGLFISASKQTNC